MECQMSYYFNLFFSINLFGWKLTSDKLSLNALPVDKDMILSLHGSSLIILCESLVLKLKKKTIRFTHHSEIKISGRRLLEYTHLSTLQKTKLSALYRRAYAPVPNLPTKPIHRTPESTFHFTRTLNMEF